MLEEAAELLRPLKAADRLDYQHSKIDGGISWNCDAD